MLSFLISLSLSRYGFSLCSINCSYFSRHLLGKERNLSARIQEEMYEY
jgi:hypothetical protein